VSCCVPTFCSKRLFLSTLHCQLSLIYRPTTPRSAGYAHLQSLNLHDTKVTDAGLKELAGMKNLRKLNLSGCRSDDRAKVTDAGLKELAGHKNLQWLDLSYTQVTDAGLKELAGLKSLKELDLRVTKVTDAGLKELVALKNLQRLYIFATEATREGVAALQKELPKCIIEG
jgi:internalin A